MLPSASFQIAFLTGDDRRYAPADGVVESHVAVVDVPQLGQHAVDVQSLHKHPGERAHVEIVEEDGYHRTHKLAGEGVRQKIKNERKKKQKGRVSKDILQSLQQLSNIPS